MRSFSRSVRVGKQISQLENEGATVYVPGSVRCWSRCGPARRVAGTSGWALVERSTIRRSGKPPGRGVCVPLSIRRSADIEAVLNEIAYVPETGVFLVTGRLWPKLLALRLSD